LCAAQNFASPAENIVDMYNDAEDVEGLETESEMEEDS